MYFYEKFFESIRFEVKNLLEIGVSEGSSIKVWLEYFPNAQIYGIDYNSTTMVHHDRFTYIPNNIFDLNIKSMFKYDFFDVVIDDGGHKMSDQYESFKCFWPTIKSDGYFVMEDMHTSFMADHIDVKPTTYEFFVDKIEHPSLELNNMRNEIKSVCVYNRTNMNNSKSSITGVFRK
jgi:trans-aconitate methyltransferase